MTYTVAFYEVDRHYGGPEEGGWWFDAGELIRVASRTFTVEDAAYAFCNRANELLQRLINRHRRPLSSVIGDPQVWAEVYEDIPPDYYPEVQPHYE